MLINLINRSGSYSLLFVHNSRGYHYSWNIKQLTVVTANRDLYGNLTQRTQNSTEYRNENYSWTRR